MEDLFELFAEVIRLRSQGNVAQAQQLFHQFEEQAIRLGISPQHPIVRHTLFEADTSSIEEMWKSAAKVIEESLEMYQAEDQIINRLETLGRSTEKSNAEVQRNRVSRENPRVLRGFFSTLIK